MKNSENIFKKYIQKNGGLKLHDKLLRAVPVRT